jgi:hypothetical protein
MLEVHDNPEQARSDGAQSIFPWQLEDLIRQVRPIAEVLDRTVAGMPEALGATPVHATAARVAGPAADQDDEPASA